ncbi:type-F conjugative transfer system pilin chaperone TraQ [Escherichia coli]|nr:type-F conjugative transfer system pilin chaperone TraQ [Escherichia coli]
MPNHDRFECQTAIDSDAILHLPRLDITGMWVFSLGVWFHIVARLVYSKPWMAFFLAELIAAILVLFGAYQVLDAWIARVSREEREALEARQQAMMAEQQEGGHVSH